MNFTFSCQFWVFRLDFILKFQYSFNYLRYSDVRSEFCQIINNTLINIFNNYFNLTAGMTGDATGDVSDDTCDASGLVEDETRDLAGGEAADDVADESGNLEDPPADDCTLSEA